jgi:electron transfer flavoprotein alpha/beta subunit
MKVLVPVRSSPHRVDTDDGGIEPVRWGPNAEDAVAVEAALRSTDTVVAVGIGDDRAQDSVRAALRMGADEGIHVRFDQVGESIAEKFATVLARLAGREDADAVFVGETSPLQGSELPGLVGDPLDWPVVGPVTAIGAAEVAGDVDDATGDLFVQRKLAAGQQEVLDVDAPVVLGIDRGFANPRRASLDTVIAGQRAEIRELALEDVAPGETRFSMSVGSTIVESVTPNHFWGRGDPPRGDSVEGRIRQMLGRGSAQAESADGDLVDAPPAEAAEEVVAYLERHDLL